MNHSGLTLMVATILVLATDNVTAERVYEIDKVFSGSSAPIAMDLNNDGIPAIRVVGGGPGFSLSYPFQPTLRTHPNPSEGAFSADLVSESVPVLNPTGRCAAGELEFEMIHYSSVHRYWNGDLLISGLKEGFTCINLATGLGYGIVRLEHLGGTGRFEGARGEVVREFQGQALDPTGFRSTLTAKSRGTLILPD